MSKQVWRFHQLYTPIMTANTGPGPAHPFACFLDVPAESSTSTATAPFIDYSTADEDALNRHIGSIVLRQDTSPQARLALAMGLPSTVQRRMAGAWGKDTANAGSSGRFSSGGALDTAASPSSSSVFSAAQPANRIANRIQHRLYDALGHRDRQWLSAALREHSYYSRTQSQGHQPARSATAAPTPTEAPAEQRRASYAGIISRGRNTLRRLHMIRVAALVGGRDRRSLRRNRQISPQTLPPQSNNGFGSVGGLLSSAGSEASTDPSIQRFWSAMMAASGSTAASPAAGSAAGFASAGAAASGTVADLSLPLSRYLRPAIGSIVGSAARSQSVKGIVSAGVLSVDGSAVVYVWFVSLCAARYSRLMLLHSPHTPRTVCDSVGTLLPHASSVCRRRQVGYLRLFEAEEVFCGGIEGEAVTACVADSFARDQALVPAPARAGCRDRDRNPNGVRVDLQLPVHRAPQHAGRMCSIARLRGA